VCPEKSRAKLKISRHDSDKNRPRAIGLAKLLTPLREVLSYFSRRRRGHPGRQKPGNVYNTGRVNYRARPTLKSDDIGTKTTI